MGKDISCSALCELLAPLEKEPEAVRRLDCWGTKSYNSQKAHVIAWLALQGTTGSGSYSRNKGNDSGRACYNRILNPGMLIWIAAVLGVADAQIEAAAEAARNAEAVNYRTRCSAFRAVIPFDALLELMEQPGKWLVDPDLGALCEFTEDGILAPLPGREAEFDALLYSGLEI